MEFGLAVHTIGLLQWLLIGGTPLAIHNLQAVHVLCGSEPRNGLPGGSRWNVWL